MMTPEIARAIFAYDPITGVITWLVRTGPRAIVGTQVGSVHAKDGYRRICHMGKSYLAHRVAWLITYGEWPAQEVDHVNGVRDDNSLSNLRLASRTDNNRNAIKASGLYPRGVCKIGNRFRASIMVNRRRLHLGLFNTPDEAGLAYHNAAVRYHGPFVR